MISGALLLMLALSACNLSFRPFVESDARATQRAEDLATFEAIYGTLPPTQMFDPLGGIRNQACNLVSCETETPTPATLTPTPTSQGTPSPVSTIKVDGLGKLWVWYYSTQSLVNEDRLAVVSAGSFWSYISQTDSAMRFELRGWVPASDILIVGESVQVRSCFELEHTWDHTGGQVSCHSHIWGDGIRAQVPAGVKGTLAADEATSRQYRSIKTGQWTYGPGWEVSFDQEVWIPVANGDLQ